MNGFIVEEDRRFLPQTLYEYDLREMLKHEQARADRAEQELRGARRELQRTRNDLQISEMCADTFALAAFGLLAVLLFA